MEKIDFSFLTSVRFWKLFLVGLTASLEEYSRTQSWQQALFVGISLWMGGSVAVRTIDKANK